MKGFLKKADYLWRMDQNDTYRNIDFGSDYGR